MPTLNQPLNELVNTFKEMTKQYVAKKGETLTKIPRITLKKVINGFYQNGKTVTQTITNAYDQAIKLAKEAINGSHISIEISTSEIRAAKNSSKPKLITGKIKFTRPMSSSFLAYSRTPTAYEVDCFVSFGNWGKLGILKDGKINLIDYLHLLLPPNQNKYMHGPIGLVTFQNGIQNDFDIKFRKMSQLIVDQFPEGPLCIGLHNPTVNFVWDMYRFTDEARLNPHSVYSLTQSFKTFAELIPKINPHLVWTHFAHSEGGLIANTALDLLSQRWDEKTKKFIKGHLVTFTYGAVKPIPMDHVLHANNIYSNHDIALTLGSIYLDTSLDKIKGPTYNSHKAFGGKRYNLTIVDSVTPIQDFIKMKLEMPKVMTLEERLNMSWYERLAQVPDLEGSPHLEYTLSKKALDLANEKAYAIEDHGFVEPTYKSALEKNVIFLKKLYKMHDHKKTP